MYLHVWCQFGHVGSVAVGESLVHAAYPASANPVFFGHYWMTGTPVLQTSSALCLDYSAGKDGPLIAYRWEAGHEELSLERVMMA